MPEPSPKHASHNSHMPLRHPHLVLYLTPSARPNPQTHAHPVCGCTSAYTMCSLQGRCGAQRDIAYDIAHPLPSHDAPCDHATTAPDAHSNTTAKVVLDSAQSCSPALPLGLLHGASRISKQCSQAWQAHTAAMPGSLCLPGVLDRSCGCCRCCPCRCSRHSSNRLLTSGWPRHHQRNWHLLAGWAAAPCGTAGGAHGG